MSDEENEYEVEQILQAKVVKKKSKKSWVYEVKWKGFGPADNTWEPPSSFEGSEHFIHAFWDRIKDKRDHTQLDLFDVDEIVFPVGPPKRSKPNTNGSAPPKVSKPRTSRQSSRDEIIGDSEAEVQEIEKPVASSSTRKRRRSAVEQAEASSAKRRRGQASKVSEVEHGPPSMSASAPQKLSRKRSAPSIPRIPAVKPKAKPVASSSKNTPSAKQAGPSNGKGRSEHSTPKEASPVDIPEINDVPDDSSSEADRAIVIESLDVDLSNGPEDNDVSEIQNTDVEMQDISSEVVQVSSEPSHSVEPPSRIASKIPAHRARERNPRIKMMDDSFTVQGGLTVKAALARGNGTTSGAGPSSDGDSSRTRAAVLSSRPGPGRSSSTLLGSSSLLTAGKNGALITVRKTQQDVSEDPPRSRGTNGTSASEGISASNQPEPQLLQHPSDAHVEDASIPTAEELLKLAGAQNANDLADFEEASDKDAEGESDHEAIGGDRHDEPPTGWIFGRPSARRDAAINAISKSSVSHVLGDVEDAVTIADGAISSQPIVVVPKPLLNPPHAIIGSGSNGVAEPSSAAWKQTTIFGPLGAARRTSHAEPANALVSSVTSPTFTVALDHTVKLPVELKDVHPPKSASRKSLATLEGSWFDGTPGKFYKGESATAMVDAFTAEGSCARVVLQDGSDDVQRQNFDKFSSRLKAGQVFIAVVGSRTLAFCSSENAQICDKLAISPNLVGLGDNVLVMEVDIQDSDAYLNVILTAEDVSW